MSLTKEQTALIGQLRQALVDAHAQGREAALRENVPVTHEDLYGFLHCSLQYAVGRRTYITGVVADQVRRYWQHLTAAQRQVLTRNLQSDVDYYDRAEKRMGDACDDQGWRQLLAWMHNNQLE